MRRHVLSLALLSVGLPTVALADAVTTRIETRPYYGAIVTIEQGVRVWRALPPHDRIIIVPENVGKVHVNIDSGRHAHAPMPPVMNNVVNINKTGASFDGGGTVGLPYGFGRGRGHKFGHGHPHGFSHRHGHGHGHVARPHHGGMAIRKH